MHPEAKDPAKAGQSDAQLTFHPLDHLAVLGVSGQDALTFLQGQGTQDYLKKLPAGPLPGAFCSVKGRVLANVWNVPIDVDTPVIKLIVHRSSAETLQRHLGKYIPFFRGSTLTDQSLQMQGLGISASAGRHWLTRTFGEAINGVWRSGPHFAFLMPDGRAQLWLSNTTEDYEAIMKGVKDAKLTTTDRWQQLDILAHYPWVEASQSGQFVPQSIGLEQLGGISFNKGCYTGQEVISRLHYKGQSKRGLRSFTWPGDIKPATDALYTATGSAGTWINWSITGASSVGLAIVRHSVETQTLYLDAERQIPLNLLN